MISKKMSRQVRYEVLFQDVATCWDICKLSEGGKNHDDGDNCASKNGGGPNHGGRRYIVGLIDCGRVEVSIEVHGNVDDPNTIEVDDKVTNGALLIIRLEKCPITIYAIKLHKPLRRRQVHEMCVLK